MADRFVRERERKEITGVPTSSWYEMMAGGAAPRPVNLCLALWRGWRQNLKRGKPTVSPNATDKPRDYLPPKRSTPGG